MSTTLLPNSLHEAIKFFADPEECHRFAVMFRWPGGVVCPYCECDKLSFISTRKSWHCKNCKKRFTVKVGTIMEDSPLSLEIWYSAMWMLGNCKNGISSCEIARSLGITQKTAWFLLHRIREAMQVGSFMKLAGTVECDETFIGGLEKNKHANKKRNSGRGGAGKEIVMGILERGGQVRTKVVSNTDKQTLHTEVKANVEPGAKVYTDAHRGYLGLSEEYKHAWVDHAVKYVEGEVHTNGLENFWSLFQRMFGGTYTHVDPQHLGAYFDELAYRFNNRKFDDSERFAQVLLSITGKRLTYAQLIERGLDAMMPV